MIVDELKKSILKAGITGKLSYYNETDTDINTTLDDIKIAREQMYKEKKITKQQFVIDENNDKYMLDFPKHWTLTQIGYLGYVVGGGTPKTEISEYWGDEISWITPKDMKNYKDKFIDVGERSITQIGLKNSSTQLIPKGSILCSSRAPIGYLGISANELTTNQGFKTLVPLCNINPEYVYYYLMARVEDLKKSGDGTTFSEISGGDLGKFYIALPPIEEQQRIVDKIEELFAKIDEMKPIEEEHEILKSKFPEDMKKSIIFSALSGKLTKQFENEKIINYLEKIKIRDVEINAPFNIPSNWEWVYFGDIVDFKIGKTPPRADSSYWSDGRYNWISIADMIDGGCVNDTKEMVSQKAFENVFKGNITPKGTLIMSFKMSLGKCSILNIDSFHHEGIISIFPKFESDIIKEYLFKVLPFLVKYGDSKNAIKGKTLNSQSLDKLLIPLPPIEEQQRIVDKLELLLPLCDEIENLVKENYNG